jgi:hypothetical protein
MISMKLDGELMRLARSTSTWYTRYADDLTFSSNKARFPDALAMTDQSSGELQLGDSLIGTIEANGFSVNSAKTRLQGRDNRQSVTGLVINARLNVDRRYIRKIRAMLNSLEVMGLAGAQVEFERVDAKDRFPGASPTFLAALNGKISYLGMVRGRDDPIVLKFQRQLENLLAGHHRREGLDEIVQLDATGAAEGSHVFVSYVREDSETVDHLQSDLEGAGLVVWRDVKNIWPGEVWKTKIRSAIEQDSLGFVPCFSKQSMTRGRSYMYGELRLAADEYRQRNPDIPWMFPTLLDDVRPPALNLGAGETLDDLNWTRLYADWDTEMARLIVSLKKLLD